MKRYDVAIIGAGPAGLAAAYIIASASNHIEEAMNRKIIIIDSGHSDALKVMYNNVSGLPFGIDGKEALDLAKNKIEEFHNIKYVDGSVKHISEDKDFVIEFRDFDDKNKEFVVSDTLVLATGFRTWNIKGLDVPLKEFERSENPTRVSIENEDYKVRENLYVCGLLSGVSSQWDIVAGSGSQVGVHIISKWAGSWKVVHDKKISDLISNIEIKK